MSVSTDNTPGCHFRSSLLERRATMLRRVNVSKRRAYRPPEPTEVMGASTPSGNATYAVF